MANLKELKSGGIIQNPEILYFYKHLLLYIGEKNGVEFNLTVW